MRKFEELFEGSWIKSVAPELGVRVKLWGIRSSDFLMGLGFGFPHSPSPEGPCTYIVPGGSYPAPFLGYLTLEIADPN